MAHMNSVSPPVRTPSPVPYEVVWSLPKDQITDPLPTPEEIEDSADVIKKRRSRCISRVGPHYVVKFGSQVDKVEGENMYWVRQNTPEVPVPKVFAIYQRDVTPRTKITYIIMEDVAAHPLDLLWDSLNINQKRDVVIQIRQAFTHLRVANNMGDFGSIDTTKPRDDIFWMDEPRIQDQDMFTSEAEFTQALIDKYMTYCGNSEPHKTQYYLRVLPTVLQGNGQPIFTHNDLRRKNILIREDGNIVIKGWATAGWYPSYWEYAKAMHVCDFSDDWHEYLGKILSQEYPNQYAWLSKLRTDLWSRRVFR